MSESPKDRSARLPDVLIVDDDPDVLHLLGRTLSRFFEVREVCGVEEALLAIELRVPDLVLTDHQMPDGGGARLLQVVTRRHPDVKRVVLSGDAGLAVARLLGEGLAHAIVPKGGDLRGLLLTLDRLLGARP